MNTDKFMPLLDNTQLECVGFMADPFRLVGQLTGWYSCLNKMLLIRQLVVLLSQGESCFLISHAYIDLMYTFANYRLYCVRSDIHDEKNHIWTTLPVTLCVNVHLPWLISSGSTDTPGQANTSLIWNYFSLFLTLVGGQKLPFWQLPWANGDNINQFFSVLSQQSPLCFLMYLNYSCHTRLSVTNRKKRRMIIVHKAATSLWSSLSR